MRKQVRGSTTVVGLIGWPVSHSLSPVMQNAAFAAVGLDFCFVPCPVVPERLGEAVRGMRALGFRGCSVTTPYKELVLPWLDGLTDRAKLVKAANTLWVDEDGRVGGDHTDGAGLVAYAKHMGVRIEGTDVLVLGAGGAARSVTAALIQAGCASLTVLNRGEERARTLIADLSPIRHDCALKTGHFPSALAASSRHAKLIVQCTSLGMGDATSLAWDRSVAFREDQTVIDLVYHPRRTALLSRAAEEGALTLDGLGVLAFQGAFAFERWTGQPAPVDVMLQALRAWEG